MRRRLYRDKVNPPDRHARAAALLVLREVGRWGIRGLPGELRAFPWPHHVELVMRRRIRIGDRRQEHVDSRGMRRALSYEGIYCLRDEVRAAFWREFKDAWRRDIEQYG